MRDDQQEEYDAGTPRLCEGPQGRNGPQQVRMGRSTRGTLALVWEEPPEPYVVFGFKVTVYSRDPASDDDPDILVPGWNNKVGGGGGRARFRLSFLHFSISWAGACLYGRGSMVRRWAACL